ncbi:MAG TPA: hypothetical protein VL326_25940 [Kofleriaceae bacterium]|nr:hypothetical protein [Kofleriaceae bacterium]
MKNAILGISLALVGTVSLVGCATDGQDEDCLPGDAECNDRPVGEGKSDAWDDVNAPDQMAQHLEYHLDKLPKKGTREKPVWASSYPEAVGKAAAVWADTYWPASEGSHNARWMGPTVKSPLEKYDAAFNNKPGCDTQPEISGRNSKAAWDTYNNCAGPAAKWQTEEYESIGLMHNGIDDDHDGKTDEYGDDGVDGVQGWWGSCHAWTPASQMVPEPQHAVTMNGVKFEVGDIKALIQNIFDQTDAVMLGGRCNAKEITHDVNGSANDECSDVNPGAMHVVLANFLGLRQLPLVEDKTANYQVWNQPVVEYNVTKQDEVDAKTAMKCVGGTGEKYTYNTNAKKLYEVRSTVSYVTESSASATPVGFKNNIQTDDYHYILEVGSTGKVIGGRYCTDAENSHIDFLWSPTGSYSPSNPNVDVAKVKQLLKMSVAAQ